jgi:molybdenum cofactor cytidylyltransferase
VTEMKIVAAILAAGQSRRMGQNKLLMPFGERTVIETVVTNIETSEVYRVIVIVGHEASMVGQRLTPGLSDKTAIIVNSNYLKGKAESIKVAVSECGSDADAILFVPGDKPTVSRELINRTIELYSRTRPMICYVQTPEGRGHPIIFSSELYPDLLSLQGDLVGQGLVDRYTDATEVLIDSEVQIDCDTRADYEKVIKRGRA